MSKNYPRTSYELICQAVNGDDIAIEEVLDFYDSYISKLPQRPIVCENGKVSMIVDVKLKGKIQSAVMRAIFKFDFSRAK